MHAIEIPLFEDLVLASGRSASEMERELIVLLAVKLFELHRVSLGQAAEIAGESKWAFTETLGRMGVPVIQWDEQQIAEEFSDA